MAARSFAKEVFSYVMARKGHQAMRNGKEKRHDARRGNGREMRCDEKNTNN